MLRKGFGEVIKEHHIRSFTEGELELMISGVGTINIRDWKDNTEYKNCKAADKVSMIVQYIICFLPRFKGILWFWRAVLSFGDARRSKLLLFVTGTSRVPMNGFSVRL